MQVGMQAMCKTVATGTCAASGFLVVLTADQCHELSKDSCKGPSVVNEENRTDRPPGCYHDVNSGKLFMNHALDSSVPCQAGRECFCCDPRGTLWSRPGMKCFTRSPTPAPTRSPSAPSPSPTPYPTLAPSTAPSSSTPSVSPTRPPSTPPVFPTRSPTAAPSVPPSLRPTGAPSRLPTALPTASPTTAPTTPPSSAQPSASPVFPSQSPTARPSSSPSAAPAGAPTQSPNPMEAGNPTPAPTQSPSQAPAPPTASPTGAVAPTSVPQVSVARPVPRAPRPAPSARPVQLTAPPSTRQQPAPPATSQPVGGGSLPGARRFPRPSAHPSAFPLPQSGAAASAAPTGPPSALPAEDGSGGFAADAASAVQLIATVGLSSAGAAQASRAIALLRECDYKGRGEEGVAEQGPLPLTVHPTGLEVAGATFPSHGGCVLGNALLACAVFVLWWLGAKAVAAATGRDRWAAQGLLRFPSAPFMLSFLLSQGACLAGSRLVRYAGGFFDVFLAVLGMTVALLALPTAALLYGRRAQRLAEYAAPPEQRTGCTLGWLGPGEWRSTDRHTTERWSVMFKAAVPEKHWVLALDMALAGVVAINTAIGGGSCSSCGAMRIMDCISGVFFCGVLVKWKPYARRVRVPITAAAQLMFACAAISMSASYFSRACEEGAHPLPGEDLAVGFAVAGVAFSFLALALNAGATLWLFLQKRRRGRRAALPESDGAKVQEACEVPELLLSPHASPAGIEIKLTDSMSSPMMTPRIDSHALSASYCSRKHSAAELLISHSGTCPRSRRGRRSSRGSSPGSGSANSPRSPPRRMRHAASERLSRITEIAPETPEGHAPRVRRRRDAAPADADSLSIIESTAGLTRQHTGGSLLSRTPSREPTGGSLLGRAPTATDGLLSVPQSSFHLRRSPPSGSLRPAVASPEDSPMTRSGRPVRRRSQRGRDAGGPPAAPAPPPEDGAVGSLLSAPVGFDWATMTPDTDP
eukprot:TRINITY_DN19096_c0_g2_i2.p1 TRINITY_DN19096_c0_g2~~TRINITY_DN19096_c0_g2_i2.p1  ORF type:complete len:980 (+),score=142.85 TRINITY_DN19096_c0_g2_i2:55-2994(+)